MACQVEVIPRAGVVVDGRAVRLEDTKAGVEQILGEPGSTRWNSLYAYEKRRTRWTAIGIGAEDYYM